MDRFSYLNFGDIWAILRILFFPLCILLKLIGSNHEIHYKADIGKGLNILHGSLGLVISAHARIGNNIVFSGGNAIGGRKSLKRGDIIIGNNVNLGINAVVLGPVCIGDNVNIGAGAVVIKDVESNVTVGGVPAKMIKKNEYPACN